MTVSILQGDCRDVLATLPADSVQCVVTSPPYYGLRDYGTAQWNGGDVACSHSIARITERSRVQHDTYAPPSGWTNRDATPPRQCACGAVRVDRQIGLEATPDEYLATMVGVFREVRRVLRPDGTVWCNLGDAYSSGGNGPGSGKQLTNVGANMPAKRTEGLAAKQLLLMPARLALALQAPQHYGPITKETDRAWMAAFMDGEGTISIARNVASKSRGGVDYCQPSYTPFISAGNQDVELVERLVQITGCGKVNLKDRPYIDSRQIKSKRDYFGWRVDAKLATAIIRDIYPFLIAKRKQAILAYNLALSNEQGRSLRGNGALPKAEQEKRELLKVLVNACNQRQSVDMPSWLIEPPSNFEQGWWVRSDIIWHKPNPMPESVTDRPTSAHEHVFLLTKSARYYYDADAVREEQTQGTLERFGKNPQRSLGGAKLSEPGIGIKNNSSMNEAIRSGIVDGGRNLRNVWTIATAPYSEAHFATYPPALAERCIKAGSKLGDTVLDPFAGAGTTLLVADRLQRDAIGVELNTAYTEMAMQRCRDDAPLFVDAPPAVRPRRSAHLVRVAGGSMTTQRKPEWSMQAWMDRMLDKIVLDPKEIRALDKSGITQASVASRMMGLGRGLKDGTADHLVVQGDPIRVLWIECKAGKGKATPAQIATADSFERCGVQTIRECRTMGDALAGLRASGFRLHGNADNLAAEYQARADAALREIEAKRPAKKKRAAAPRVRVTAAKVARWRKNGVLM